MCTDNSLYIDLQKVADKNDAHYQLILDDNFFRQLDQDEIQGGNVTVNYNLSKPNDYSTKIQIELAGQVTVICDRCLEDLKLDVAFDDESTFEVNSDEQAFYYTDEKHPGLFNIGWYIYEAIVTSLPIERCHPDNECNGEMTQHILSETEE